MLFFQPPFHHKKEKPFQYIKSGGIALMPSRREGLPIAALEILSVGIPIIADQAAFTIYEVYEICQKRAADMICIGPVEVGGIQPMLKVAAIAESAGLKICIHSSFSTGITTSAEYQIGKLIPNIDDGNQIMCQLLKQQVLVIKWISSNSLQSTKV